MPAFCQKCDLPRQGGTVAVYGGGGSITILIPIILERATIDFDLRLILGLRPILLPKILLRATEPCARPRNRTPHPISMT
jgi:hypothetical protein